MKKYLAPALALAVFTAPAFASGEWFVVKNEATKKCELTEKKPDGKTMMMIGKTGYKTKADAEKVMKADAGCK